MAKQKKAKAAAKPSAKLAKLIEKPVAPMATPLRLEYRTASELASNPSNWRTHPQRQLDALRDVIADVGWAGVCLFNEATGRLIDGHARKAIAGNEQVPVLIGSWSEAQERQILATLDPLGAMAVADKDRLDTLLREVQTGSESVAKMLEDVGRRAGCEWAKERDAVVQDDVPEPPKVPVTKPGDLWVMGEHRLLCGDSTKAEDVARVMGGERASMLCSDPPYAKETHDGARTDIDTKLVNFESMDAGEIVRAFSLFAAHIDRWIISFMDWRHILAMESNPPNDCRFVRFGIWVKPNGAPQFTGDRPSTGWEAIAILHRDGHGRMKWNGGGNHAVWTHNKVNSDHPTGKPVPLVSEFIQLFSDDKEAVFDPFAGSGTTLIAAHQLNRRCFGLELAPAYVDVAVQRWESLTGQKAKLQRGA